MEPGRDEISRFASGVNGSHVEAEIEESGAHDAPHDMEIGRPASEAAIGGVGQEAFGGSTRDEQSDRASPSRMELGESQRLEHRLEVADSFSRNPHGSVLPEPTGFGGCFT